MVIGDNVATSDPETHPHQDGNSAADSNWLLHVFHDAGAGRWRPSFVTEADIFDGPQLQKNVTYRFEFRVTRTGTSTLTMDVRIYDSNNTLLFDGNNFPGFQVARINSGSHAVNVVNTLGQFNAGLNGLGGAEWGSSVVYMYQGAVAISASDWVGPYAGGI
jgi:prophage tail gpP-like protein